MDQSINGRVSQVEVGISGSNVHRGKMDDRDASLIVTVTRMEGKGGWGTSPLVGKVLGKANKKKECKIAEGRGTVEGSELGTERRDGH